jgi:hypothetical protein
LFKSGLDLSSRFNFLFNMFLFISFMKNDLKTDNEEIEAMLGNVLVKVREASVSFGEYARTVNRQDSVDSRGESVASPRRDHYFDDSDHDEFNDETANATHETSHDEVVIENVIDFDHEDDSLDMDDSISPFSRAEDGLSPKDAATKTSEYASDSQDSSLYSASLKSHTLASSLSHSPSSMSGSVTSDSCASASAVSTAQKTNRANSIITLIRHKF